MSRTALLHRYFQLILEPSTSPTLGTYVVKQISVSLDSKTSKDCSSSDCCLISKNDQRQSIIKRGQLLQYATLGYCGLEGIIGIVAGFACGSVALVGFGLDSAVEVTSGVASLARLKADGHSFWHEKMEKLSLQIIGVCFIALALYVAWESIEALAAHHVPEASVPGIFLALSSVLIMPRLAKAKKIVAQNLGSAALKADSNQAVFCSYLSAILLLGLVLNTVLGWWWADSVSALCMVPIIGREGLLAIVGKSCNDSCC